MLDRLEQIVLEEKYSRTNMRKILRKDILSNSDKFLKCKQLVADYLAQEFKYSRAERAENLIYRINSDMIDMERIILDLLSIILISDKEIELVTVAGLLAPHLEYEDLIDGVKIAADLTVVCCESDLYDMYQVTKRKDNLSYKTWVCKSNYQLQSETISAINRVKFLPPMLIKPDEIINNNDAGFLTMKESVLLKKHNRHNFPIALDVINIQNSIPLCLDEYMLEFEKEFKWKTKYDSKSEVEMELIKSQFEAQQKEFVETYNELLDHGNEFYLLWRYDARGRFYPKGYQVSCQGTEYDKAILSINHFEFIEIDEKYL